MRWLARVPKETAKKYVSVKKYPPMGTQRTMTRFLWLPLTARNLLINRLETRWLSKERFTQEFVNADGYDAVLIPSYKHPDWFMLHWND